jgi:proline dehydrogenase
MSYSRIVPRCLLAARTVMMRPSMALCISCQHCLTTVSDSVHRGKNSVAVSASTIPEDTNKEGPLSIPDFNNNRVAFETKSTASLLRAYIVFQLCRIKPLVNHADQLLHMTRRVFGDYITDSLLKATLFGHFCGGEDEERLQPAIADLRRNGIGGILDYAAESDVPTAKFNQPAREYSYESEAACDGNVSIFRSCIRSVANVSPNGFAAIKITALGNPLLLERMSQAIVETKNLFAKFDINGDGRISRDEFERAHR